ncbi:MAG: hypothetical protein K2G90_11040 [Muribaculaceae bacterium]|nr:hypothetical protein [Muribaculaceae bacterium]
MTDIKSITTMPDMRFFRSEVELLSSRTAVAYQQAINILENFLAGTERVHTREISAAEALQNPDFIIYLALQGYSYKTTRHYLDILSSLLNKYNTAIERNLSDSATSLKNSLNSLSPALWDNAFSDETFRRLLAVTKNAANQTGLTAVATDILLLSLLNSAMPIEKIALLKISDAAALSPESSDIVRRNTDPKRRYIFPLDQSRRTPRQLTDYVEEIMRNLMRLRNLPQYGSIDQTLRTFWAYTALRAGIKSTDIVATAGTTAGFPALSCVAPQSDDGQPLSEPPQEIAEILLSNPRKWYAMRLRPYTTFKDLTSRLQYLKQEKKLLPPPLFYPSDEIARKTGKKIQFETKPVIRDIVFFNSTVTDILPLFSKIGDLAWCYKNDGAYGNTYAAIPARSFERFQQTIGHFTPDYEVAPIGTIPHRPGEKIEIIAGPYANKEATLISIEKSTLYRCYLIGDNGIEWKISVDPRQIK